MHPDKYQETVIRKLIDQPNFKVLSHTTSNTKLVSDTLNLFGSAYEIGELVRIGVVQQRGIDIEKLSMKIGEMLWHVTLLCTTLGLDMSEMMQTVTERLKQIKDRYPLVDSATDL